MAVYLLSMFYPNVKVAAGVLKQVRTDVQGMAGSNWRVVSAGEHTCAIAFETALTPEAIRTRLGPFDGIERFEFLLVRVAEVVAGYLGQDTLQWLRRHPAAD